MYRYLVFAYERYYPGGGMSDCILKTNDLEEAMKRLKEEDVEVSDYKVIYDVKEDITMTVK